ncbi:MAG: acetyl-CoA carboxylase biotin carboxyl carrier protein [Candidatus Neomarinimicrobiota bacterium]|nr:MAG: acetyl-CoA carboxylase, biotin carboxyl carrier protein [Candidatus Marinimicrobia bacterium TMED108]RCL90670.1 MAG: acetyl-CoA carboxylase biotin carboxyl carrier protein [bacterium]|tara:strand:- start:118 stop:576 length:459 start_codon:yes stop_codon:yes gene_type:complete
MWQDKLKEIIYILENSDVNEIDINFWGRKYRVVKSPGINIVDQKSKNNSQDVSQIDQLDSSDDTSISSSINSDHSNILSPMPGTFYAAPSPEADLFVKAGDIVNKGDTLCIIEAMKIMNEIEAESTGIISEVLIKNGDPVEYNQPLFKIKSS